MCCLFGLIDTELRFTGKEKSKMLHVLASASEERGTDARCGLRLRQESPFL